MLAGLTIIEDDAGALVRGGEKIGTVDALVDWVCHRRAESRDIGDLRLSSEETRDLVTDALVHSGPVGRWLMGVIQRPPAGGPYRESA